MERKTPVKKKTTKTTAVRKTAAKKTTLKKPTTVKKKEATAIDFESVLAMAKEWGVGENPLLRAQIESFLMQRETIAIMKKEIEKGALRVEKDYGHGGNQYLDPILKELPRFTDQLNKTVAGMIDTITRLGTKPEVESVDDLQSFLAK